MTVDPNASHWGVTQPQNPAFTPMPLQRMQHEVEGHTIAPQLPPFDVPPPTQAMMPAATAGVQASYVEPVCTTTPFTPVTTAAPVVVQTPPPPVMIVPPVNQLPVAVSSPQPVVTDTAIAQRLTIQQLLRNFEKQPGCERYSGDANKVKLIQLYLLLRQLTPALGFEMFLKLYTTIADYDEKNLKHPDDAVDYFLPRTAKKATERNVRQWTAREVVDYLALFVDIVREAEAMNVPVPMDLNTFLGSETMQTQFINGDFDEVKSPQQAEPAPAASTAMVVPAGSKPKKQKKLKPEELIAPVTGPNQRVIYTMDSGRQLRGYTMAFWIDQASGEKFVNFITDAGEQIQTIHLSKIERCDDPPPNPPQTPEGETLPVADSGSMRIPKAPYAQALRALAMTVPIGTVRVGDSLDTFTHQFADGHMAVIEVVNGETGPYVDARLVIGDDRRVVNEVNPPRRNLDGVYTFNTATAAYIMTVTGNV